MITTVLKKGCRAYYWLPITVLAIFYNGDAVAADGQAKYLGRLFTTPEQRQQLNELRHNYNPDQASERRRPSVGGVTLNGVVIRSGGQHSVWVNGRNTLEGGQLSQGIKVDMGRIAPDRPVIIHLPETDQPLHLKPGQTYQVTGNQILEAYETPRVPQDGERSPSSR